MKRRPEAFRVKGSMCPSCGRLATGALEAAADECRPPRPGDVTVCINCAAPSQFDAGLQLAPLGLAELAELQAEQPGLIEDVREAQRKIVLLNAKLGPPGQVPGGRA
jgi:hypothetical protein